MWPTAQTPWFLIAGFLPLLYAFSLGYKYGISELLSLRFLSVFLLWIGYHFSPLCAYVQGSPWESFLLSPKYLDQVLLFSALSMYALLTGYGVIFTSKYSRIRKKIPQRVTLPKIKAAWIVYLITVVFFLAVYNAGGFADFWDASYTRGMGQWAEHTAGVRFQRALNVLISPLQFLLVLLSSIYIIKNKSALNKKMLGYLGLLVGMLPMMHEFSRATGFTLFVFAFLLLKYSKRNINSSFLIIFLLLTGYHLGSVGLNQRGFYHPGIKNYVEALFFNDNAKNDAKEKIFGLLSPELNPIDASAPFSRRIEEKTIHHASFQNPFKAISSFILHINPIPSGLFNPGKIGEGLSSYMKTVGHTGLTSPALSDVFYAFSYFGLFPVFLLGIFYGYFARNAIRKPGLAGEFAVLLCMISIGIGLHSGIRAQTRPVLYAFLLIWIANNYFKKNTFFTSRNGPNYSGTINKIS